MAAFLQMAFSNEFSLEEKIWSFFKLQRLLTLRVLLKIIINKTTHFSLQNENYEYALW